MKKGDIVIIKSLNIEGMILNIGTDLYDNKEKFCIICEDEKLYFAEKDDIIIIDNFKDRLNNKFNPSIQA